MSRSDKDDMPDFTEIIGNLFAHFAFGPGAEAAAHEAHQAEHQEMIRWWESIREPLADKFGVAVAADLVELPLMSFRFCVHGHPDMGRLIASISDLVSASQFSPEMMALAAEKVQGIVKVVMAARQYEEMCKAKPKSKAKSKAKSKPEIEANRAKAKIHIAKIKADIARRRAEVDAEAQAEAESQAEAARRQARAQAERN